MMTIPLRDPTEDAIDVTLLDPTASPVHEGYKMPDPWPPQIAAVMPKAVYTAPPSPPVNIRRAVLEEAITVVCGEREMTYGGPEDSFRDVAEMWTCYIEMKLRKRIPGDTFVLKPYDVALMMGLMKTVRQLASDGKHRDSWVDLGGYAACGAECGIK